MATPDPTASTPEPDAKPPTARARARAELTQEIKDVAHRQMEAEGAASLSLRAVAREIGMVSSAVYRYFPSRDELLTALIIDAYNAVGDAAEAAEAASTRSGFTARWLAVASAIRHWARSHRADYDLVYGGVVPGYLAPTDTVAPAARVSLAFIRTVVDAVAAGEIHLGPSAPIPRSVHADFANLRDQAEVDLPDQVVSRALVVWTQLFGTLSFELHGHLHNVIVDHDAFFDLQMRQSARYLIGDA